MNKNHKKSHWSFWLISSFLLVWNVLGCVNFFMQMNPDIVSTYREIEQAIIQGRPLWATVGFALGIFAGASGCVLLLVKMSSSFYLFCASLFGVLIRIAHSLAVDVSLVAGEIIGIVIVPIAISVFLIWYSQYCQKKGWLRTHSKSIRPTTNASAD